MKHKFVTIAIHNKYLVIWTNAWYLVCYEGSSRDWLVAGEKLLKWSGTSCHGALRTPAWMVMGR